MSSSRFQPSPKDQISISPLDAQSRQVDADMPLNRYVSATHACHIKSNRYSHAGNNFVCGLPAATVPLQSFSDPDKCMINATCHEAGAEAGPGLFSRSLPNSRNYGCLSPHRNIDTLFAKQLHFTLLLLVKLLFTARFKRKS